MTRKNLKNLLIAAGLASVALVTVPALSQASRYTGVTPPSLMATSMTTVAPAKTVAVKKHTAARKHTAKKLTASKAKGSKKKAHTTTIVYKHHHKKTAAAKTKKHSA